jgi:hypothetical protein
MNIKDIPIRPMTNEQAKEIIKQMGGEKAYREAVDNPPLEKLAIERKSDKQLTCERFSYFAKRENLSLEEWLRKNPELYQEYRKL